MTQAAWQKGIDIDVLKSFGALFKERHRPLVFGAFGLTKERDIAEAMSKESKTIIWTGKPPEACALFNVSKVGTVLRDFAQRELPIAPGTVVVRAFACRTPESGCKILKALRERAGDRPMVAEIFEEDETAKAAVQAVGFSYAATKISAGSEIKGLYVQGMPGPAVLTLEERATQVVLNRSFFSAKKLALVRAELAAYGDNFAQHYSDYNKRKSWTSFALRGYQDDPSFIIKPGEMAKAWKEDHAALLQEKPRWTKAIAHFAETKALVKDLGLGLDRVRFMRLRAKDGELSRHADITDREAGVADGMVARLHIPIHTNEKAVEFVGWSARGERMTSHFPAGCLFYLDQRKPHAVTNRDPNLDRVHLVIDVLADTTLRGLISNAEARRREAAKGSSRAA